VRIESRGECSCGADEVGVELDAVCLESEHVGHDGDDARSRSPLEKLEPSGTVAEECGEYAVIIGRDKRMKAAVAHFDVETLPDLPALGAQLGHACAEGGIHQDAVASSPGNGSLLPSACDSSPWSGPASRFKRFFSAFSSRFCCFLRSFCRFSNPKFGFFPTQWTPIRSGRVAR
jgi:hypothetical protein